MIARLYVDNYKCLSNFECRFGHINLMLGANGSGKSTVFDVLRGVRAVVTGTSPISLFRESTLTRWQKRDAQTVELEIAGGGGIYQYHLEVEHEIGQNKQRIQLESVKYDGGLIYRAELGETHLFRDDYSEGPIISGDWTRSSLPFLGPRHDNTRITWFKDWFRQKLLCLQIDPVNVKAIADEAEPVLDAHALNYVGWYRHRVSTDMSATIDLYNALKEMYEEFRGLTLEQEGGSAQHLFARLGVKEEQKGRPEFVRYSFGEFSEGERALVILYTLLQLVGDPETTLCLDEPDNFLSLSEIQPWLLRLREAVDSSGSQSLLISHHPELINNLAPRCGLVFERRQNGPARVRPFDAGTRDGALTPSEVVARGWE